MKNKSLPATACALLLMALSLLAAHIFANDKKAKPTYCSNPHPEQLCTAANTCGSNGSPCVLEVKRVDSGTEASVTPNIPDFPKKTVLCINIGTSVTWQGAGKNTGLMVDFGDSSPFEPSGPISGGSDRPVTVVAKKAGCFKYSVGACTPGSAYGMCGNSDLELIVKSAN
jgi:hypothetical protein